QPEPIWAFAAVAVMSSTEASQVVPAAEWMVFIGRFPIALRRQIRLRGLMIAWIPFHRSVDRGESFHLEELHTQSAPYSRTSGRQMPDERTACQFPHFVRVGYGTMRFMALPETHSLNLLSIMMVTGPSFRRRTCISAPKRPVGMGRPRSADSRWTNCSYKGTASSGRADRL